MRKHCNLYWFGKPHAHTEHSSAAPPLIIRVSSLRLSHSLVAVSLTGEWWVVTAVAVGAVVFLPVGRAVVSCWAIIARRAAAIGQRTRRCPVGSRFRLPGSEWFIIKMFPSIVSSGVKPPSPSDHHPSVASCLFQKLRSRRVAHHLNVWCLHCRRTRIHLRRYDHRIILISHQHTHNNISLAGSEMPVHRFDEKQREYQAAMSSMIHNLK